MEQIFEKTAYESYNNKTKEEKQALSDAISNIKLNHIIKSINQIERLYGDSLCSVSPIEDYDAEGTQKLAEEMTKMSKIIQQDVLNLAENIRIAGKLIKNDVAKSVKG